MESIIGRSVPLPWPSKVLSFVVNDTGLVKHNRRKEKEAKNAGVNAGRMTLPDCQGGKDSSAGAFIKIG